MSKDLAFYYSEQEAIENPPVIIQEESNEYIELLKRIQSKEETLSFSSLKEFATSPKNFIKYKLKERKKPTDAVLEGSVCDALLCDHIKPEREEFETNFSIVDNVPTTDNQIAFCNLIIDGKSCFDAKKEANPRGDAVDLQAMYQSFIDASKSGKQSVSRSLYDKCVANIKNRKVIIIKNHFPKTISYNTYNCNYPN